MVEINESSFGFPSCATSWLMWTHRQSCVLVASTTINSKVPSKMPTPASGTPNLSPPSRVCLTVPIHLKQGPRPPQTREVLSRMVEYPLLSPQRTHRQHWRDPWPFTSAVTSSFVIYVLFYVSTNNGCFIYFTCLWYLPWLSVSPFLWASSVFIILF